MGDIVLAEIQRRLVQDSAVAAIADGRIYDATAPPGGEVEYPNVTIQRRLSGEREPWEYSDFPLTVSCAARTSDLAADLYTAVDAVLHGYRGHDGGKYWYIEGNRTPVVGVDTAAAPVYYYFADYRVQQLG